MLRLLFGFVAGFALGRNAPRLALRGSRALRRFADRLDRLAMEPKRVHSEPAGHEREMVFRPAA